MQSVAHGIWGFICERSSVLLHTAPAMACFTGCPKKLGPIPCLSQLQKGHQVTRSLTLDEPGPTKWWKVVWKQSPLSRHDQLGTAGTDCLQNGQGWCQRGQCRRQSVLAVPWSVWVFLRVIPSSPTDPSIKSVWDCPSRSVAFSTNGWTNGAFSPTAVTR